MPIDTQDSSILDYKPKIRYYQKRIAELDSGFVNPVVVAQTPVNSDLYIQNLNDLLLKANSLSNRIDAESAGLKIPVNPATEPNVSSAVLALDPSSNGEYISYETYNNALQQLNAGIANLDVESIIASASNDETSNSRLIQASIYAGYASFAGTPIPPTNSSSDTISGLGDTDSNLNTVVNFSDNFLSTYPDTQYLQWTFKPDVVSESANINNFIDIWSSSSPTGAKVLSTLGGILQDAEPLAPDPDITDATNTYLQYTNDTLNGINSLFDSTWSSELMCCFMNFLVASELKTILAFIALLALLKTMVNLDFKDLLSSFKGVLANIMRNLIIKTLLNIIMQIYQRVVQPIEDWVNTEVNTLNQLAALCPVVEKFVQTYIVGAVQNAEKQFKDIIVELMKNIELQKINSSAKISNASTCNWINQATKAMNLISQAMQMAKSTVTQAQNSATQAQNIGSGIANQAISLIPSKSQYTYPNLSNPNSYNTFPVPIQTNIPNPVGILNCGQNLPSSLTPASPNWKLGTGGSFSNTTLSTSNSGYTLST